MKKSNEPFWWGLFSAGGVVTAFLAPALILVTTGFFGWDKFDFETVHGLIVTPIGKLVLLVFISFSLLHWAHRFRFTLLDLGIHGARCLIAMLCYGGAIVGTILAVVTLLKVH